MVERSKTFQAYVQVEYDGLPILDADDYNRLTRTILDVDPITGNRSIDIYSDDGRGNGNHLIRIQL